MHKPCHPEIAISLGRNPCTNSTVWNRVFEQTRILPSAKLMHARLQFMIVWQPVIRPYRGKNRVSQAVLDSIGYQDPMHPSGEGLDV